MKQEMYSNIIGREVWEKCQKAKIWISDYDARIELEDNSICDRIDICYDKFLEKGEVKYVDAVYYSSENSPFWGEEYSNLNTLSIDEQKKIFDIFEKELAKMLA